MPLEEQMYTPQQIKIPPKLPYILKKYAKAAIRTQPYDLLRWSMEYFKALAECTVPPVKCRFEHPVFATKGGLTRGFLKVLIAQLAHLEMVPMEVLESKWLGACLNHDELKMITLIIEAYEAEEVDKMLFFAVAASLLTQSLKMTMVLLCESLTKEPEGGCARIPREDFLKMYKYLAKIDGSRAWNYMEGVREDKIVLKPSVDDFSEPSQSSEESDTSKAIESDVSRLEIKFDIPRISLTSENGHVSRSELTLRDISNRKLENVDEFLNYCEERKKERIKDISDTLDELKHIVHDCDTATYDLGTLQGRQMSLTSGEFVAQAITEDLVEEVDQIIEMLPPAQPRKLKATEEDVAGITDMLKEYMDDVIENKLPDLAESLSTEGPEVVKVPPIPGIGPVVPRDMLDVFVAFCEEVAKKQEDMVMPRNLRHFLCPPMEIVDGTCIDEEDGEDDAKMYEDIVLRGEESGDTLTGEVCLCNMEEETLKESKDKTLNEIKKTGIITARITPFIKNKIHEDFEKKKATFIEEYSKENTAVQNEIIDGKSNHELRNSLNSINNDGVSTLQDNQKQLKELPEENDEILETKSDVTSEKRSEKADEVQKYAEETKENTNMSASKDGETTETNLNELKDGIDKTVIIDESVPDNENYSNKNNDESDFGAQNIDKTYSGAETAEASESDISPAKSIKSAENNEDTQKGENDVINHHDASTSQEKSQSLIVIDNNNESNETVSLHQSVDQPASSIEEEIIVQTSEVDINKSDLLINNENNEKVEIQNDVDTVEHDITKYIEPSNDEANEKEKSRSPDEKDIDIVLEATKNFIQNEMYSTENIIEPPCIKKEVKKKYSDGEDMKKNDDKEAIAGDISDVHFVAVEEARMIH